MFSSFFNFTPKPSPTQPVPPAQPVQPTQPEQQPAKEQPKEIKVKQVPPNYGDIGCRLNGILGKFPNKNKIDVNFKVSQASCTFRLLNDPAKNTRICSLIPKLSLLGNFGLAGEFSNDPKKKALVTFSAPLPNYKDLYNSKMAFSVGFPRTGIFSNEFRSQFLSYNFSITDKNAITFDAAGKLKNWHLGAQVKTGEKTAVRMYCNWLSGSIGKLFTYKDAKPGKKPSLIRLSQNEYMECFGRFPNRTIVGCVRFDIPVKFCSAMGDIHHPVNEYADDHILVEDDTRICSFAGYEGEDLEYYKKEIFNETVSKKMYYPDTKHLPSPDIDEEIKVGLEKIKKTVEDGQKYEEMEDVCIPDTINQVEVPVSVLKLFNQISFRRIIIDFSLPMLYKMGTHYMYIGLVIGPSSSTVEAMIDKTVSLFSNIILADFIRTSEKTAEY